MKITNIKINHLTDPVGYELSALRVSWCVTDAKGVRQTQARVRVAADPAMNEILYDSGFKACDPLGEPLPVAAAPRTRYYVDVAVRSDAGEEAVGSAFFETAKQDEPWEAKWLGAPRTERRPVFLRTLDVKEAPARARLYICGLGAYEASIDGVRVGDEYMAPYCNNYARWAQYQTYDVTELVKPGGELRVLMGESWFLSRIGFSENMWNTAHYGDEYKLIAELRVDYADGTSQVIGTDERWRKTLSNITFDSIYDGERVDLTLTEPEAEPVRVTCGPAFGFHEPETAEPAALTARYSLPVRVLDELPGAFIRTPAGECVVDLGQNITGSFRLDVCEPAGTRIFMQFGEVLQDGNFYRDNLRSAKAEYEVVCDGKAHTLQPKFTFYGYRFAKIVVTGERNATDEELANAFTGLALSSDLEDTGCLATGNAKINRLIQNIFWGCRDNFLDVPTDCPQRDERLGWTGDANVFSPSAMYLHDAYAFYRKYLHDMDTEQRDLNGEVPHVIPSFGMGGGCCVWGDAATCIPTYLWRAYGDRTILREQFESMRMWVDWITRTDGDDMAWRKRFHFGDWLALDRHDERDKDTALGGTDTGFLGDVHYMDSAKKVADAARLIGLEKEAAEYDALSQRIRDRILKEYYTPTGRCAIDTQTGLLLSLRHGLGDREAIIERLREKLEIRAGKLDCGFIGATFMLEQLSEAGMDDQAVFLLLNEEYPGWLYEVNLGATTIWERWNSLTPEGKISSTGMNSLNHYAFGSIFKWMTEYMAGLQMTAPGYRTARIKPIFIRELGYADLTYRSASGAWRVKWTIDGDDAVVEATVPFGAEADLILPGLETERLTAGAYTRRVRLPEPKKQEED